MNEIFQNLPPPIRECVASQSFKDLGIARLGNALFRVKTTNGHDAILKIGTGQSAADIDEEATRLKWLNGRCKAPILLAHAVDERSSWSVQTFVGEHAGHRCIAELPRAIIIQEYAQLLQDIHGIPIDDCPFVSTLELELHETQRRLQAGEILEEDFVTHVKERPSKVFDYLVNAQHLISEDCFTHGDYSLPNVLFHNSAACGVVDWGQGAVSDRHRDFMSVELSIRRNMDKNYIHSFYEAYDIKSADNERIRYYWLLDRFSTHCKPGR